MTEVRVSTQNLVATSAGTKSALRRVRGFSDRTVAWLFVAPTILLLLAINIFPLFWAIGLSFTNYRANQPNAPIRNVGLQNYQRILTDGDPEIEFREPLGGVRL